MPRMAGLHEGYPERGPDVESRGSARAGTWLPARALARARQASAATARGRSVANTQ